MSDSHLYADEILEHDPDGLGLLLGTVIDDNDRVRKVNIMPPRSHSRRRLVIASEYERHDTDWIIYLDGKVARHVQSRDDLIAAVVDEVTKQSKQP